MSEKSYSLCSDGEQMLAKNFRVKEFCCRDGSDRIVISEKLVELLQTIRDHFGKPVVIHSAYRTEAYNAAVGGAPKSQHKLGTAADISIAGVSPQEVAQVAERLLTETGGIGVYGTFTHVDVRQSRARWDSRSGREVAVSGWNGETESDTAVNWLKTCGIMKGDGVDLLLERPVTRKEFALMLYRYHKQTKS